MLRCKLFGVSVQVDFWFVALVTVFLLTDRSGVSVIALLACFIHECAHLLAFFAVGYTPRALVFELTGIRLVKPAQELSPKREVVVQLAGSGANLLVFALLAGTTGSVSYWSIFAVTHLLLGVFNLLPLRCLDGGKLLLLFCAHFWGETAAERACAVADFLVTVGLLGVAGYTLVSGERSMSLLFFSGGLFVALLARLRPCVRPPRRRRGSLGHREMDE